MTGVLGGCTGTHASPVPSVPRASSYATASVGARAAARHTSDARERARGTEALGYTRGRPDAPTLVVEFTDFGCHYCGDFARDVLPTIDRESIASGLVRWRLVPIATASTPHAREAAAATICAGQFGKAWAMHDLLFARQREWTHFGSPLATFAKYARELGMDEPRALACLGAPSTRDTVEAMRDLARQLGVRIAPTFFVAGRRVEGAISLDDVRAILRGAR
ncbi:MAG: thioredoxin domain-containing protein [Gemmatimonadaceae bacterium]